MKSTSIPLAPKSRKEVLRESVRWLGPGLDVGQTGCCPCPAGRSPCMGSSRLGCPLDFDQLGDLKVLDRLVCSGFLPFFFSSFLLFFFCQL
jgi:hypothetical protein